MAHTIDVAGTHVSPNPAGALTLRRQQPDLAPVHAPQARHIVAQEAVMAYTIDVAGSPSWPAPPARSARSARPGGIGLPGGIGVSSESACPAGSACRLGRSSAGGPIPSGRSPAEAYLPRVCVRRGMAHPVRGRPTG
jgi:hypothetical protein